MIQLSADTHAAGAAVQTVLFDTVRFSTEPRAASNFANYQPNTVPCGTPVPVAP